MELAIDEDGFEIFNGQDLWAMLACVECERYHKCLASESSTIQDTYTYHSDFEEPAHLRW